MTKHMQTKLQSGAIPIGIRYFYVGARMASCSFTARAAEPMDVVINCPRRTQAVPSTYTNFKLPIGKSHQCSILTRVCSVLNEKCKDYLNRGFATVEHYHAQCLKDVKSQLPRRESERRCHSMARHCDILNAIETRLSMLSMTYSKYMDTGLCCFIPGKVIDEIFRVLRFIKHLKQPPRAHEILQELRDISSMAMEHFDEKIVPGLKEIMSSTLTALNMPGTLNMPGGGISVYRCAKLTTSRFHSISTATCNMLRTELIRLTKRTKRNRATITHLKKNFQKTSLKAKRQHTRLILRMRTQAAKIAEQETQIAEMKRQHVEWDQKIADLTTKLNKVPECKVNVKAKQSSKQRVDTPTEQDGRKQTRAKKPRLA